MRAHMHRSVRMCARTQFVRACKCVRIMGLCVSVCKYLKHNKQFLRGVNE